MATKRPICNYSGVLSELATGDSLGGGGDVLGPGTNTADYVPQWSGANSKTLADGFAVTAAGKAILDDTTAADQRTTLGLGDSATKSVGTTTGTVATGDHTHEGGIGISFEDTDKPKTNGSYSFIIPYALTVPANASTSGFSNKTNPSGTVAVSIKDDGTEIATLSVASNGTPTWATSGGTSKVIAAGSVVTFLFPAQNSTWAGVVVTLKGNRA